MDLDQKRSVFRNECENKQRALSLLYVYINIYTYSYIFIYIYKFVNFFISSSLSRSRCVLLLSLDQRGSFSLESAINPNFYYV